MEQGVSTLAQKLAIVNNMRSVQDILSGLLLIQFSNDIPITQDTTLEDLVEPDYPGYTQVPAQTGSAAYEGADSLIHSTFPDLVFVATAGQTQQTTATVSGTVTTAGNWNLIVTSAGMAGSPVTVVVALALGDDANTIAAKGRSALLGSSVVAARFNVGGTGPDIVLTRKIAAANDATLNVEQMNDTSTGPVDQATSTATRAGSTTGSHVDAIVVGWGLLNAAGDTLLYAARLDTAASLTAPGQGGVLSPDYVYGG